MGSCSRALILLFTGALLAAGAARPAWVQDDAATAAVRKNAEQVATLFNAGKVDELVAVFLPKAELIDEEGAIH